MVQHAVLRGSAEHWGGGACRTFPQAIFLYLHTARVPPPNYRRFGTYDKDYGGTNFAVSRGGQILDFLAPKENGHKFTRRLGAMFAERSRGS